MKQCMYCKEDIKKDATVCPHCQREQVTTKVQLIILFRVLILLAIFVITFLIVYNWLMDEILKLINIIF